MRSPDSYPLMLRLDKKNVPERIIQGIMDRL